MGVQHRAATAEMPRTRNSEDDASLLASIVNSSDDAIFAKTLDGVITSWNPAAVRMYGYSADEMIGRAVGVLIREDRANEMPTILDKIRKGQPIEHYETERVRKDGTTISVSLSVSPIHDRDGRIVGASTIARDIGERSRAEEAARTSAQYASSLIDSSDDAIDSKTLDGTITTWNRAAEMIYGYTAEEMVGKNVNML